jgi:hypothetical protein
MSLFLASLSVLLYAFYKIVKTGHDVKTLQASVLEKHPPTPETSEQISERNLRLERENQQQIEAIAGGGRSNHKTAKLRTKKFNDKSRGAA